MLEHIRKNASIAFRQWRNFLSSKIFRIVGVAVPLVIAVVSWFVILNTPSTTADGTNRWDYFQSELKRYNDEVKGEYAFEQSDERFVYYVIDGSGLNLAEAIRREILKRDISNLITFVDEHPRTVWKSWFSGTESDSTHQNLLIADSSRLSAREFIERYSLKHDSHRSYLLKSDEKAYSWFVDGWNQHYKEIARQIPAMSFAQFVEIVEPNEDWYESGVFKGYLHFHELNDDQFGQVALYINNPAFSSVSTEFRDWYQSTAIDVLRKQSQNSSSNENIAELPKPDLSFVIGITPRSTETLRPSETQGLARRVYSFAFLLAIFGGWCLLYFDRNLSKSAESNRNYSSAVIDGRVFGTTLQVVSFVAVWFFLLVFPSFGLVGSTPELGLGALGVFFNPQYLLHWWTLTTIGIITFGYIFQMISVIRGVVPTFSLFVLFFVMVANGILTRSLEIDIGLCFLPIVGPFAAIGLISELPNGPMYILIVLVSLVNLILIRQFCFWVETRARAKGRIEFDYVSLS